jgi:hypothetical protein
MTKAKNNKFLFLIPALITHEANAQINLMKQK